MVSVMRIYRKRFYKVLLVISVSIPRQVLYIFKYNKNGFSPTFTIPACFHFLTHCTAIDCTPIWHSFPDILGGGWESAKQFIIK